MTTNGNITISDALKDAVLALSKNETIETPRLDAEVLLCCVLNCQRIFLTINKDRALTSEEFSVYSNYIKRRKNNEPISYITGKKEFMSLDFIVKPGVLIPRPDTEILVEEVIHIYQGKKPKIIDICSGSGAISVSLAHYLKDATVYALDKYDICVQTTSENAKLNVVDVSVLQFDIFDDFNLENDFDCVVSNPPYIEKKTLETLSFDVKDYEPEYALDGGDDGLIFYRRITELASVMLKKSGILAYEIGYNQAKDVSDIISNSNNFRNIRVIKDLSGHNRVIIAEKE